MSDLCEGPGGFVYVTEGPQFGPQWVEETCNRCGEWYPSPADRASGARWAEWEANPGPLRRLWRRMRGSTDVGHWEAS